MKIEHTPFLNKETVIKHYSEKDGVDISYVCTSSVTEHGCYAYDIFYRETPHPVYGNRYFGLTQRDGIVYIANADNIENLIFNTVLNEESQQWVYSQHRHDFRSAGNVMIDGGRSYQKLMGDNLKNVKRKTFVVKDGKFGVQNDE